ncbi:MAG TPA: hypothetical protein VMI06_03870 [Terriglobia bacterium]|nr:hypothetical protein [Terriglobia bacterium]
MTRSQRVLLVCVIFVTSSLFLNVQLHAQSSSTASNADAQPQSQPANSKSQQVDALKKQLQEQQKQISELRAAMKKQQKLLKQLAQKSASSSAKPQQAARVPAAVDKAGASAETSSTAPKPADAAVKTSPSTQKQNALEANATPPSVVSDSASAATSGYDSDQQLNPAITNSPIPAEHLKIGNAILTPVGFVDATEFFRTENLGSGIGSSFGGVPFSNTTAGQLTENRLSIQNSRIGAELDDVFHGMPVRAYWESDFLGYQPNGAFQTSNSDSFRLRLFWARVRMGKFDFLAGQSWSLMTPGRTGISPMPSNIFYSQDMDTNYQVGLTWSRQLQFRFTYHASPAVTAALSIEDSDPFTGGATIPTAFASEVDNGTLNSAPAFVPDIVGKLAFDPKVNGRDMHFEFAGLFSGFKTYNPATSMTNTATGGGGEFNFNLELWKNFHLIATSYYSSGGGRYIIGLFPDFIVRPDGTISPVQTASGIGGFEDQVTPHTMFYGYYSSAYSGRDYTIVPGATPTYYGWGYPGSSNSENRNIQEPTFGWIQTFWKNPHYGALQLITQYSYLTRSPWVVASGSPKNAHLNMVYLDVRYVLP